MELAFDAALEKINNKTMDIMGPLSRLWYSVDQYSSVIEDPNSSLEDPPQLPIDDALQLIEQTVLLVGQCCNTISCDRRKSILSSVTGSTQASSMLKEKAEILRNDDGSLFGTYFRDEILENQKAEKKSKEAFSIPNTSSSISSKQPSYRSPFRLGPPNFRYNNNTNNNNIINNRINRGGFGGHQFNNKR